LLIYFFVLIFTLIDMIVLLGEIILRLYITACKKTLLNIILLTVMF